MKILKGCVRNQNWHEGCIVECYIYEETVEFFNEYLSNVEAIGLPKKVRTNRTDGTCNTPFPEYVLSCVFRFFDRIFRFVSCICFAL